MNVFITVWNRHTWLEQLCKDFVRCNVEPVLIDNNSTYPPCVEWLDKCPYTTIRLKTNEGPWAFFTTELYKVYTDRYFMVSDSDQDIRLVPEDFPSVLLAGLSVHTEDDVWKCGLSQEIDDLPDNPFANEIKKYEKGYWSNKTIHGFYKVWMDIGIAVYDRTRRTENPTSTKENGHRWFNAVRADRPYTSRHLDWYLTPENLRAEDLYYIEQKDPAHRGWLWKLNEEYIKK